MNPADYARYTDTLIRNLAADDRVLGLIAVGSMAATGHQPDQWSDHDFFVIAGDDAAEPLRADVTWLPDSDRIVLAHRETAHGLKVLYSYAHLVEYAVFTMDELLHVARFNRYRVLLDRAGLTAKMAERAEEQRREEAEGAESPFDTVQYHMRHCIVVLMVGAGRHARGEQLSGHVFVKQYALFNLLRLLTLLHDSPDRDLLDNLDAMRRFERVYPALGAEINALLLLETPECARRMLDLVEREASREADYPAEAVTMVRRYLEAIP